MFRFPSFAVRSVASRGTRSACFIHSLRTSVEDGVDAANNGDAQLIIF